MQVIQGILSTRRSHNLFTEVGPNHIIYLGLSIYQHFDDDALHSK